MANLDCAIVLAGGEGKRMKSNKPKVLSQVLFQPMLKWVVDAVLRQIWRIFAWYPDLCMNV